MMVSTLEKAGRKALEKPARKTVRRSGKAKMVRSEPRIRHAGPKRGRMFAESEIDESELKTTRDSVEIRNWAELRGGMPAIVKGGVSDEETTLWIEFPGSEENKDLELVSWEEWYDRFLDKKAVFEYLDREKDGRFSRHFRVICD